MPEPESLTSFFVCLVFFKIVSYRKEKVPQIRSLIEAVLDSTRNEGITRFRLALIREVVETYIKPKTVGILFLMSFDD